jgi:hypothetical protein
VNRIFRDYGLGIVLALMFAVSWIAQTLSGWVEFAAEQQTHGQAAQLFGPDGYIWPWLQSTMENWQSEFLQLFTMAVLTAFLVHKGSTESKDGDEEVMLQLSAIREDLAALRKGTGR